MWTLGPDFPELRKGATPAILDGKVISAASMRHPWLESPAKASRQPVRWRGGESPRPVAAARPVQLRLEVRQADLHGFHCLA